MFTPPPYQEVELCARLKEDPRRAQTTWESGVWPLRWVVDGKRYSPPGLVKKLDRDAGLA